MSEKCFRSLRFRIYPTQEQQTEICKTFGCYRKVYNSRLEEVFEFYKTKQPWREFHPTSEKQLKEKYPYLKEVSAIALQAANRAANSALENFKKRIKEKTPTSLPKFKSKKNPRQSFEMYVSTFTFSFKRHVDFENKILQIPKIGKVLLYFKHLPFWTQNIKEVKRLTVLTSSSGKFYCTLLFELSLPVERKINQPQETIGLDFNLNKYYVDSNGKTAVDFGYRKIKQENSKRLKRLKRSLSRKQPYSNNWKKARIQLARFEEKISNKRKNWIEKETLRLVTTHKKVVVEDLDLPKLKTKVRNARNYEDTSWGTFLKKLEDKGKEWGCEVVKADRFFPSSQLCSVCGAQNHKLTLNDEIWKCPRCQTTHQRDFNAAVNLANYIPENSRKSKIVENSFLKKV